MFTKAWVIAGALMVAAVSVPLPAAADHEFALVGFDAATNYGDAVTLKARMFDTDANFCSPPPCPEPGASVDFYVDGAYVGSDTTNSGGWAYLLLTAAPSWHAGAHEIRVQYDRLGQPNNPAVARSTLTISPEVTIVDAQAGYLRARLTDDDGAALAGQSVRFTVTDPQGTVRDVCTAITGADGSAQCTQLLVGGGIAPFAAVRYDARFDGTGDFVASADGAALL